jgi:50S ribosomal subunit-associated GTPase HflX
MEVENKPVIYVFNKIDRLSNKGILNNLKSEFENSVFTSALEKNGFDELREKIIHYHVGQV